MRFARSSFAAVIIVAALGFTTACMPPAEPQSDDTKRDTASPAIAADAAAEREVSEDAVMAARVIIDRAQMEAYKNLTDEEKERNRVIAKTLHDERITALSPGLPAWVKENLVFFEGDGDYDFAFSRSVAWGTGTYRGKPFYWFAHTNSDAWLQMNLSVALDQKDIDQIYGRKPDDLEGVAGNLDRKLDVELIDPKMAYAGVSGKTLIGTSGTIDWTKEYCAKLERTLCDTGGAFEKYLLAPANEALPGLSFKLVGRIPR